MKRRSDRKRADSRASGYGIDTTAPRRHTSLSKQLARSEPDTFPAIHGRTHVEVKAQIAGILGRESRAGPGGACLGRTTAVKVNHVAYLLAAAVNDPVVSVKRRSVTVVAPVSERTSRE